MSDQWRVALLTNTVGSIIPVLLRIIEDAGHRPVVIVTTPGPKSRASASYLEVVAAAPRQVDVIVTNRMRRLSSVLEPYRLDLGIAFGFPWILPAELIDLPRLGTINFHDSLLPKYRGVNAEGWQFRNGETRGGMTLHWMTPELDRGNILSQVSGPILDGDDHQSIVPRFVERLPELFQRAFERVAAGDPGDPQDEAQATYATPFEPEWREIDWNRPARLIHNQVRSWIGVRDFPRGAYGTIDGRRVLVLKTRLVEPVDDLATGGDAPGTMLSDDDGFLIQCGEGRLRIVEWRWEE
jgi:methionyl-tRNA formyltransferase